MIGKARRRASFPARVEGLEPRQLLSAAPIDLAAEGFIPIQWNGQEAYARPGQWILQLDGVRGNPQAQVAAANQALAGVRADVRATKHLGADGLFLVETPAQVGQGDLHRSLNALRGFRFVEPDFAVWTDATTVPNDPSFSQLWGMNNTGQTGGAADADIDAPEAWSTFSGSSGVVVAVIDSGVAYTHSDLAANAWRNAGEVADNGVDDDGNGFIDDVYGWDFANNDNNPIDDNGHGTHVAGTIAAAGNNGVGVAGVSWNAKVMALKFLNARGSGTTSGAISAVNYATMMRTTEGVNVRVTNNSWGGGGYSSALYDAIKRGGDAGILFVASAGNGGRDSVGDNNDITPSYPASYNLDAVISVAATDKNDQLAYFSNYGATSVDIAAPGVSIYSTWYTGGYNTLSGTSMAAPHVSGAAALAWGYKPDATAAHVRSSILAGVDVKTNLTGKLASNGRLNLVGALEKVAIVPTAPTAPSGLAATVVSATRVDLVWVDNSSDELGFKVLRAANGGTLTAIATLPAGTAQYSDTSVSADTTYTYAVVAYNAGGEAKSGEVGVTTPVLPALPSAPSELALTTLSASSIRLDWSDNASNEDGFRIERSTNGAKWSLAGTTNPDVNTWTDSGLRKNTTYYYRVLAFNAAGNSAYSNTASTATLARSLEVKSVGVFSKVLLDDASLLNVVEDGVI